MRKNLDRPSVMYNVKWDLEQEFWSLAKHV